MKTIEEIYNVRIDSAKTDEEIKEFYQDMIKDTAKILKESDEAEFKPEEAENLVKANLGYILGYHRKDIREKWYKLFRDVVHPWFGAGFGRGEDPTPQEAFDLGVGLGKEMKAKKEAAAAKAAADENEKPNIKIVSK